MQIRPLAGQQVPLLGFAAFSGTGKTTLLEQLIPLLAAEGLRIGLIKLSHHDFEIDVPGKDSYRLRKAGARRTLIASPFRRALITETPDKREDPDLVDLLGQIGQTELDLVLVEGGRNWPVPKIELHRPSLGKPLLCLQDRHIIALASDAPVPDAPSAVSLLDINNISQISVFILSLIKNNS